MQTIYIYKPIYIMLCLLTNSLFFYELNDWQENKNHLACVRLDIVTWSVRKIVGSFQPIPLLGSSKVNDIHIQNNRHDITEILLKVALITITIPPTKHYIEH